MKCAFLFENIQKHVAVFFITKSCVRDVFQNILAFFRGEMIVTGEDLASAYWDAHTYMTIRIVCGGHEKCRKKVEKLTSLGIGAEPGSTKRFRQRK